MKFTQYFLATRLRPDRATIKDEWIEFVIAHPIQEVVQTDGRIKRWAKINEMGDRVLRVIPLGHFKKINVQGDWHWPMECWSTKLFLASDRHLAWIAIFLQWP